MTREQTQQDANEATIGAVASTAGLSIDIPSAWEAFCGAEDIGGDVLTCIESALVAALFPAGIVGSAHEAYLAAEGRGSSPIEAVTAAITAAEKLMHNAELTGASGDFAAKRPR